MQVSCREGPRPRISFLQHRFWRKPPACEKDRNAPENGKRKTECFTLPFIGITKLKMFLFSIYLSWNILQQNITRKRISWENGKKREKTDKSSVTKRQTRYSVQRLFETFGLRSRTRGFVTAESYSGSTPQNSREVEPNSSSLTRLILVWSAGVRQIHPLCKTISVFIWKTGSRKGEFPFLGKPRCKRPWSHSLHVTCADAVPKLNWEHQNERVGDLNNFSAANISLIFKQEALGRLVGSDDIRKECVLIWLKPEHWWINSSTVCSVTPKCVLVRNLPADPTK